MKGLLIKEWYSLIGMSNFKVLLCFGVAAVLFGMTDSMSFMLLYLPIIAGMMPRTVLITDEYSKWTQFSLAMPYSRRDIVSAKYLATLILCTVCSVFSVIVYAISSNVKGSFSIEYLLLILFVGIGGGILIPSFSLPVDLKLGSAKGKAFTLVYGGILGGVSAGVMNMSKVDLTALTAKAAAMMKYLPMIGAAVVLLLFAASWMIAVKLYENREF